jgi:hypothetical protein
MKNLIIAVAAFLFCQTAQAQRFSFGLKGGMNTQVQKPTDILIGGGDTSFQFGVDKLKFGTQFGAYFRFGKRVFIQPEILFNSNTTNFKIGESSIGDIVKNEKYHSLDLPVMLGFKLGAVRVQGGPVGHYHLNSTSELTDINGYKARFKQMTWGYQTGINIAFGRLSLDARYEGNFSKFGDHVTFFGDKYQFSNAANRLIVGLNFAIVK